MRPAAASCITPSVYLPPSSGCIPSCSAPTTLPRRMAGSTLTPSIREHRTSSAAIVWSNDSARLARPAITTTGPDASWAATSASASSWLIAATWVPGSYSTERHASADRPLRLGASSTIRFLPRVAASRMRR